MNRTRCFLAGAALLSAGALQPIADAQAKPGKEPFRAEVIGISLGDRVVAREGTKDRTKQRTLFNVFGNPTAVVVPGLLKGHSPAKSQSKAAKVPDWAQAVTTKLDDDHILWLYRRPGYAMAFRVNRQGIIDAITVAQTE